MGKIKANKTLNLSKSLGEKCGIFGCFGEGFEAARLTYFGLYALQHRGQESSGIVVSNGKKLKGHIGSGLVAHVYEEGDLKSLKGFMAIGHNRYSTSGGSVACHSQPVFRSNSLALAHNGNLPSTKSLEKFLRKNKVSTKGLNDSELIYEAISISMSKRLSVEEAVRAAYPYFTGVFCLLVMTKDKLIALRDACGIRPLSIGKLNGGFIISSETCALDVVGAKYVRDVREGEMVVIDKGGLHSYQLISPNPKFDIFEFVYFARPDSILLGKRVNEVRKNLGKILAREHPVKADVVIPVPDSAIPAALGYAQELGIPFDHGLIKNRYIHRTFIKPEQHLREKSVQIKLNPITEVISDKKVVVVDDSIVRGTTQVKIVKMLRDAGAKEVHVRISSPPHIFPDFYGIDIPDQKALIAARMSADKIANFVGADSLKYISFEGMVKATGYPKDRFSAPVFTGVYPISIGEREKEVDFEILSKLEAKAHKSNGGLKAQKKIKRQSKLPRNGRRYLV